MQISSGESMMYYEKGKSVNEMRKIAGGRLQVAGRSNLSCNLPPATCNLLLSDQQLTGLQARMLFESSRKM
jgi:hypothetical protein